MHGIMQVLELTMVSNYIFPCYQFYEIMWNKVGKLVELVIARQDSGEHVNLSMLAVEARQDQFNRSVCF